MLSEKKQIGKNRQDLIDFKNSLANVVAL